MTRKILITAIKWNADYENAVHKGLAAAKKKYKDGLLITVGYTIIGVKIASIAAGENITVQMFAPDLNIQKQAIDVVSGITVTSTSKPEYMRQMLMSVDGVMALDPGDPIVLAAKLHDKPVWFPLGNAT